MKSDEPWKAKLKGRRSFIGIMLLEPACSSSRAIAPLRPAAPEGVIMAAFLRKLIMAALNDGMCGITLSRSLPDMTWQWQTSS